MEKITVEGKEISIRLVNEQDYISLTDIAKKRSAKPADTIRNWINTSGTFRYLITWEELYNPDFQSGRVGHFKEILGDDRERIRIQDYISQTGAIGIFSKSGRYGGTYAHKDIAFEFASWIEPVFKLFVFREFQRLKSEEYQRKKLQWDLSRELTKLNYSIQTEAIKQSIIPRINPKDEIFIYADEADLLNLVLFGRTARQWREANPNAQGNIRDNASFMELTVLANLESFNAQLIQNGASKEARFQALSQMAAFQLQVLTKDTRLLDE